MDLAKVSAALADPLRIAVIQFLAKAGSDGTSRGSDCAGVCVCELVQHLKISQPRASYHLRILREVGIVSERPQGKWTYYKLNNENVAAFCERLAEAAGIQGRGQDGPEESRHPRLGA